MKLLRAGMPVWVIVLLTKEGLVAFTDVGGTKILVILRLVN